VTEEAFLSYGGSQKYRQSFAAPPKICVHLHLETERKYSSGDIFHAISFGGILGNYNDCAIRGSKKF